MRYNRYMDYKQVIKLLETEKECISRKELSMCNKNCAKCECNQNTYDLLDAYNMAIRCIKERIEEECKTRRD